MDGRWDSAVIGGELSPDGTDIILSVTGGDWQLQEAQQSLRHLTVLPKVVKSRYDGRLFVPCTWAVITQLARLCERHSHVWRPDPNLNKWIEQEFLRRFTEDGDLAADFSALEREPMPHQKAGAFVAGMNKRFFFGDDAGPQPVTTPVLTPAGWTELGKLTPGDYVYSADGEPTRVMEIKFFGSQPVYRVTFNDRTSTLATGTHRWSVYTANDRHLRNAASRPRTARVMTTEELRAEGLFTFKAGYPSSRWYLPQQPVISDGVPVNNLPLSPYLYGALLGDGNLGGPDLGFTSGDEDILSRVITEAAQKGTTALIRRDSGRTPTACFHRDGVLRARLELLDALHLAEGKYVHPSYLAADEQVRRDLLRGLLDTDGHVQDSGVSAEFVSVSSQLAADVAFLGRSLGGVVTEAKAQESGYVNTEGRRVPCQDKYRVYLRFPANAPNPFWCKRKSASWEAHTVRVQRRNPPRTFRAIELEGEMEVCCIRVKHSAHVYLTDTSLIPTHNTGKTMTMLMTLAELEARGETPFPAFIVCPSSVVDPWLEELEECFPDWPAVAYSGAKRKLLSTRYKVYVMSWAVFRDDMNAGVFGACQCEGRVKWTKAMQKAWDEGNPPVCKDCGTCYEIYDANKHELPPLIKFLPPKSLVLDEAHCLCVSSTRQTTAAKRCARIVPNLLLASGTPITHDVGGFWSAMSALDIRSFPNADRFKEQYADTSRSDYGNPQKVEGLTTVNREEFFTVLQGSFRHTSKLDVLKDLPPKTYSTRVVEIPGAYRAAYDEMQKDMIAHLPDTDEPLEVMSTLVQLQRLTQLASSACDVEYVETDEWDEELQALKIQVNVTMREPCWKVDDLMAVMDDNQGQPIVTFAPHTQLINIAGARAEKAGYRVGYIKGGQTRTARTAVRRAFQAGEIDLLCCNVASGGVGLTLTASHIAVMLERPFAFWQASQSEDRIHRRGQTEQVHIIDIVAANSVESRVRAALKEKAGHLSDLVRDERIVRELLGGQPIHIGPRYEV